MQDVKSLRPGLVVGIVTASLLLIAFFLFSAVIAHDKVARPDRDTFGLKVIKIPKGNLFGAVRINERTGAMWFLEGLKWTRFEETSELPEGDYEAILIDAGNDNMTARMDRRTGATWFLQGKVLRKIEEP
jgi:hypothetical protein